ADLALDPREHAQALVEPRPAVGLEARAVGLVEGGLEHERQLVALGEVARSARHLEALRLRLDDGDPCDERERRAIAQSNRSDLQFGAPPDTTASVRPRRSASTAARSSSSRSGRAEVTRDQF